MDLILVRHARAFDRDIAAWPDDARRPLTASGRDEFILLAKQLKRIAPAVEMVEASGFVRAWQTARILAEQTGWPQPSRLERLEAESVSSDGVDPIESLVRALEGMAGIESIAWVGHEPMLSRLASRLLAGSVDAMSINFKKGAAVAIRVSIDGKGPTPVARGELLWMLTPRLVARMKRRVKRRVKPA